MSKIDAFELARDVIERFCKPHGVYPCFEHLIEARSGLGGFECPRIKFSAYDFNEHTQALVQRLADVFDSVYGKRPIVTVYTPHKGDPVEQAS